MSDLVDGAAIFSAGGGGDPEAGHKILDQLISEGYTVRLVTPSEVPDNARIFNFACVGATTTIEYDAEAAVKTLKVLEESASSSAYAAIPVELGGFNTSVAVDVAARCNIPVVDADGAGRSVPEVHLKIYTLDDIPLTPMAISDSHARNIVVTKKTADHKAAERISRILAAEWGHSAYTARRILTGYQVKTSPIQLSLSKSICTGKLLRKTADPISAVLKETRGFRLFEGIVDKAEQKTQGGFTFVNIRIKGKHDYSGESLELKAKNEVLIAKKDGELAAIAPDIITPLYPETGKCITAEKIDADQELVVVGLPTPRKWRTSRGIELWKEMLQSTSIPEEYVPIEELQR